jgi:hypothetical protein
MPLFSSSSVKESPTHHNKLEKSPHARAASLSGRRGSIKPKQANANGLDEDASTKAMAGSSTRLMRDENDGGAKPLTPKSLAGSQPPHSRNQSVDAIDMRDAPPTPPPHDHSYIKEDLYGDEGAVAGREGSVHTSSTWRGHPDTMAAKGNHATNNPAGYGTTNNLHLHNAISDEDSFGLSGDRSTDLATARQKVQLAIEAELAADRALEIARRAVIEARNMVRALEKQINEEYVSAHLVLASSF